MTLTLFKTYVKLDFKRTDKDTELVQAYNDMIKWLSVKMPHSAYKYQSYLAVVAGQEDYPLPSNIIHLIHPVKLMQGSGTNDEGYALNQLTKYKYDEKYPNPNRTSPNNTGIPIDYCVYSGSILIGPLPQAGTDDLLEIDWTKRPTVLNADADTSALGSEWDEVLKQGTLERLYAGIGQYDEAQYWASQYRDTQGNPVGMCKDLFDIEKEKEDVAIGQVQNNDL